MSTTLKLFVYLAFIATASRGEPLFGDISLPMPRVSTFVVSIIRSIDKSIDNPYGHVCGGALITPTYALTAASCFEKDINKNDYFVLAGDINLANGTKLSIDEVIKFDDWYAARGKKYPSVESYNENDIAIVRLSSQSPVLGTNLWNISPELLAAYDVPLRTAGWARFNDGTPPQYMLGADLKLIDREECLGRMGISPNETKGYENFFCTRGVGRYYTKLDVGDKGSPIFVKYKPGKYRIVGINLRSVPETSDVRRWRDQRNTHISVSTYRHFLKTVMGLEYL